MLVTFRSDAYENLTFFGDVATRLLSAMGHSGTIPGAIKADNVAEALHNLQKRIGKEKKETQATQEDEDTDNPPEINLSLRAIPLIKLLQAAEKQGCDVLWDYH